MFDLNIEFMIYSLVHKASLSLTSKIIKQTESERFVKVLKLRAVWLFLTWNVFLINSSGEMTSSFVNTTWIHPTQVEIDPELMQYSNPTLQLQHYI